MGDMYDIGEASLFTFRAAESTISIDLDLRDCIKPILQKTLQVFLSKGKPIGLTVIARIQISVNDSVSAKSARTDSDTPEFRHVHF